MKFQKSFQTLTEQQTELLFNHSAEIFRISAAPVVVMPEPLSRNDRTICYKYLELPNSLVVSLQERILPTEEIMRIGYALALIHTAESSKKGKYLLHGDFVPHNIFSNKDKVFIIDPHPPERLEFREDIIYGDWRRDIISFIFGIFSDVGFREILPHRSYYMSLSHHFLDGYSRSLGSIILFVSPLLRYTRDIYLLKRKACFSRIRSFTHCIVGCFITIYAIGRYICKQQR